MRHVRRPNEDAVAIFLTTSPPTVEVKLPSMEVVDHVTGLGRWSRAPHRSVHVTSVHAHVHSTCSGQPNGSTSQLDNHQPTLT